MDILKKSLLFSTVLATTLSAHSMWVNSFESFSHKPGHTTVGIGWGHTIPVDDIMNSPNGKIIIENFTVESPDGKIVKLRTPESKIKEPTQKSHNFDVLEADVALQKIALKKQSKKGTYKIHAVSKPTVYTKYIDTKNRERLKLKTMDKIEDIKKVLMSVKYQAFASTYLTVDKWEIPKATNKGLEIIPLTDLSNLKVGDLVEFDILFYGKPLNTSASSMDYITARSKGFGQSDGFSLMSYIKEGRAQFRVQTPGQWIVTINHKEPVMKKGSLKDLYKKVNSVFTGSSLTFNVK